MTRPYEPTRAEWRRRTAERDALRHSAALLDVPPTPDIATLETAADALARVGDFRNAVALWAIALRLRMEANE